MRLLGIFASPDGTPFHRDARVIVRTSRGQETGQVLCEATPDVLRHLPQQMEENKIIRVMTHADILEAKRIHEEEHDEFSRCSEVIKRMKIEMNLVRIEHIFGGERIIIYYVAEGRVDFRELVKVLASEFQTRVEMRQIGVRDETKLLSDFGDCGKECCCNSYLTAMPPVSMKMAKMQKATLDPTKISGRCGRLKCCLRYEYSTYLELLSQIPAFGAMVTTAEGTGRVVGQEILRQRVYVEFPDQTRKSFSISDVEFSKNSATPENLEVIDFPKNSCFSMRPPQRPT
jgi:cell fate regulator YaaT (PSP1 superfamily)